MLSLNKRNKSNKRNERNKRYKRNERNKHYKRYNPISDYHHLFFKMEAYYTN